MADPGSGAAAAELRALLGGAAGGGVGQQSSQAALFQALQQLRDSGDPSFLFLRTILELTSNASASTYSADDEQLLFHCVGGLRHVLLHKWSTYAVDFVGTTRDFLLTAGLASHLPRTVANSCLGCAASLWKRGWLGDDADAAAEGDINVNNGANVNVNGGIASPPHSNGSTVSAHSAASSSHAYNSSRVVENAEAQAHLVQMMAAHARYPPRRVRTHAELFQMMESMIPHPFNNANSNSNSNTCTANAVNANETHAASQATTFLSLLLGEISGTSLGGAYNLPLERHRRIHAAFEAAGNGLDATLSVAMAGLGGAVRVLTEANALERPMIELCAAVVGLVVDTLSWEFGAGSRTSFILNDGGGGTGAATLVRPP